MNLLHQTCHKQTNQEQVKSKGREGVKKEKEEKRQPACQSSKPAFSLLLFPPSPSIVPSLFNFFSCEALNRQSGLAWVLKQTRMLEREGGGGCVRWRDSEGTVTLWDKSCGFCPKDEGSWSWGLTYWPVILWTEDALHYVDCFVHCNSIRCRAKGRQRWILFLRCMPPVQTPEAPWGLGPMQSIDPLLLYSLGSKNSVYMVHPSFQCSVSLYAVFQLLGNNCELSFSAYYCMC